MTFALGVLVGMSLLFFLLAKATKAQAPTKLNEEYGVMVENPEVTEQLYEEWKKVPVRSNKPSGWYPSCVIFAKQRTGFTQSVGAARNWPRNSSVPVVGGVVITRESYAGHVAVITAVRETDFDVIEANYVHGRVSTRTISIDSRVIIGYWK